MQISHALRRTLSVVSIPREVPGTRVNLDTCRRGYLLTGRFDLNTDTCSTWKFFNPERKSCGLKNIRIRVDSALVVKKK